MATSANGPGLCECGRPRERRRGSGQRTTRHRRKCWQCAGNVGVRRRKRQLLVGDRCERCGFRCLDPVQLEIDHIDSDRANNSTDNLQVLCANCHRLKTELDRRFGVFPDGPIRCVVGMHDGSMPLILFGGYDDAER